MAFGRKRVYGKKPLSWGRTAKRSVRKRTFKRSKRSSGVNFTSNALKGFSLPYLSRKTSSRAYRRRLWNNTLDDIHYRSVQSIGVGFTTAASSVVGVVTYATPLKFAGNPFWTAPGGARQVDTGTAIGAFRNIILRGGIWGMLINNTADITVQVKFWLVWTAANADFSFIPSNENIGWDPTVTAEWNDKIGKPYFNNTLLLTPGESYKIERRIKIKKIDEYEWANNNRMPLVVVQVTNATGIVSKTINASFYYNLSFSGQLYT